MKRMLAVAFMMSLLAVGILANDGAVVYRDGAVVYFDGAVVYFNAFASALTGAVVY